MEALGLNLVDWTIIIVITASVVLSITRGFVKEFLSLFIWVLAFFAAVNFEFLATPKINAFRQSSYIKNNFIRCCFYYCPVYWRFDNKIFKRSY